MSQVQRELTTSLSDSGKVRAVTPTLKLGPWDSPSLELMPQAIEPLLVLAVQRNAPLNQTDLDAVWSFVRLNTVYLGEHSKRLFLKLEEACKCVVSKEVETFDADAVRMSEFAGYLDRFLGDGVLTPTAKHAAQVFLDFLAAHPTYWPPRF